MIFYKKYKCFQTRNIVKVTKIWTIVKLETIYPL